MSPANPPSRALKIEIASRALGVAGSRLLYDNVVIFRHGKRIPVADQRAVDVAETFLRQQALGGDLAVPGADGREDRRLARLDRAEVHVAALAGHRQPAVAPKGGQARHAQPDVGTEHGDRAVARGLAGMDHANSASATMGAPMAQAVKSLTR
jgi:hypothetical protein